MVKRESEAEESERWSSIIPYLRSYYREKEGCRDVRIDNSGKNDWNEADETRYNIFDICGVTKEGGFIASEVKLTTVSSDERLALRNDMLTEAQFFKEIKTWNNMAPKYNEPLLKRGSIISIYSEDPLLSIKQVEVPPASFLGTWEEQRVVMSLPERIKQLLEEKTGHRYRVWGPLSRRFIWHVHMSSRPPVELLPVEEVSMLPDKTIEIGFPHFQTLYKLDESKYRVFMFPNEVMRSRDPSARKIAKKLAPGPITDCEVAEKAAKNASMKFFDKEDVIRVDFDEMGMKAVFNAKQLSDDEMIGNLERCIKALSEAWNEYLQWYNSEKRKMLYEELISEEPPRMRVFIAEWPPSGVRIKDYELIENVKEELSRGWIVYTPKGLLDLRDDEIVAGEIRVVVPRFGVIRTRNKTYLLPGFSQELVWRSDFKHSGVESLWRADELNKLAVSGFIDGLKVLFIDFFIPPIVIYQGKYIPAVIIEDEFGLRLGELALPSGKNLVVSESSMTKIGIQIGLLKIVYPNKETYIAIYTGGDIRIPMFSYLSGAFVAVQAVETKVIWTGAVGQKEFYTQMASVSELLENAFGQNFKEELLETVLQSELTEIQVLDMVNALVKNLEWLKTLGGNERIESVKKIAYHVKNGDTIDKAIKKVKK